MTLLFHSTNAELHITNREAKANTVMGYCSNIETVESNNPHLQTYECSGGYGFYDESMNVIKSLIEKDIGSFEDRIKTSVPINHLQGQPQCRFEDEDDEQKCDEDRVYKNKTEMVCDTKDDIDFQINGLSLSEIVATDRAVEVFMRKSSSDSLAQNELLYNSLRNSFKKSRASVFMCGWLLEYVRLNYRSRCRSYQYNENIM